MKRTERRNPVKSLNLLCGLALLSSLFVSGCGSKPHTFQAGSKEALVSDDEAKAIGQKLFDMSTTKCGSEYIWSLDNFHSRFASYKLVAHADPMSRGEVFRGTRWMGNVVIDTSVLNAEGKEVPGQYSGIYMYLLNRAGHWYYTTDSQFEHGLIPVEDMQSVRDSCDQKE